MSDSNIKPPASSEELSKMFNFDGSGGHNSDHGSPSAKAPSPADLPVLEQLPIGEAQSLNEQLPVQPAEIVPGDSKTMVASEASSISRPAVAEVSDIDEANDAATLPDKSRAAFNVFKKVAPYLAIFAIGIGLYYFYFSDFSFNNLFRNVDVNLSMEKVKTNKALEELKKNENANYQNWISQFFFDVSDQNIIGMDTDVSGNGLTNFEKYLLNLNPKMYDTLGTGVSDGQSIIDGRNPWTGKDMTERQKTIAEAYFDKELISNRIAAAQANRNNLTFAPYVSNNSPYYQPGVSNVNNGNQSFERVAFSSPRANADNSSNGEVAGATVNTNPAPTQNNTVNRAPARTAPATGVNSEQIGSLGINTNVPGRVDIPSLKVSVPIVWTKDPKNFERDLKSGVVHYPGTPLPGDIGTSYISGHSSGYFYDKSAYKQAFAKLGNLKDGEKFTITVTLKNGKKATLHYKVGGRATYAADDQRQFVQTADQVVALSTCWPINTTAERLVVYGTLTQIEK